MQDFNGKVAVITGGASGIGLGLARRFAGEGARVAIGDIEKPALDAAVDELRAGGTDVEGFVVDTAHGDQVDAFADAVDQRFGQVDIVCNNAGVGGGGLSWELPLATWEWIIGVNLWGVVHGVRAFVPRLITRPEAHIVNTASIAGLVAAPFMGPYSASKHAVVAITETLHHELSIVAPQVKASVLCPAWVKTNIADSERNRPDRLRTEQSADGVSSDMLRSFIDSGISPDVVAGRVFDAIRNEQFWVLTHDDEGDMWVNAVNRRVHSLEARENPTFGLPQ